MTQEQISIGFYTRAFVSTRPLVQKHVKLSLGKWLLETTRPDKHVKILENIPSFFTNFNYFQPLLFTFESCVLIGQLLY